MPTVHEHFVLTNCRGVRRMHPIRISTDCERAPISLHPARLRMAHCFAQIKREISSNMFWKISLVLENISLRIVFFYNRYAISIRISPYVLI